MRPHFEPARMGTIAREIAKSMIHIAPAVKAAVAAMDSMCVQSYRGMIRKLDLESGASNLI